MNTPNAPIRRLTVGDNSGMQRRSATVVVRRATLADIAVGERVLIRFRDDFEATPYREYICAGRDYYDEWDERRGVVRAAFRPAKKEDSNG